MDEIAACLLCDEPVSSPRDFDTFGVRIDCPRCGTYEMTFQASINARTWLPDAMARRYLISGLCRQRWEHERRPLRLTQENLDTIADLAPTDVLDQMDMLLLNVAAAAGRGNLPGGTGIVATNDYPLAFSPSPEHLRYVLGQLERQGLIEINHEAMGPVTPVALSAQGWMRIRELRQTPRTSRQAFVAMNFSPELVSCYDHAIEPAIREAGYKPLRVDREEHSDRIDDFILSQIKRSRFLVADFTGQRFGVYFEAGYAFGLGLPVIWTCHESDLPGLHFDTRQYNHIVWASEDELRSRLQARIEVLIN
jgi:hypothetical protein